MIVSNRTLIRREFKAEGIKKVAIKESLGFSGVGIKWLIMDMAPNDARIEPDGAKKASVYIVMSKEEIESAADLEYTIKVRARSAAKTVRAMIDQRKPEEIPA